MKRSNTFLVAFALMAMGMVFLLNSCVKKEDLATRCENKLDAVSEASTAFISNPTPATCEDYKDAWLDYADACDTYQYYNSSLEASVNAIDCSVYAK